MNKNQILSCPWTFGGSINGGTPKMMVYVMEIPWKVDDDWRYPYFRKPPLEFLKNTPTICFWFIIFKKDGHLGDKKISPCHHRFRSWEKCPHDFLQESARTICSTSHHSLMWGCLSATIRCTCLPYSLGIWQFAIEHIEHGHFNSLSTHQKCGFSIATLACQSSQLIVWYPTKSFKPGCRNVFSACYQHWPRFT